MSNTIIVEPQVAIIRALFMYYALEMPFTNKCLPPSEILSFSLSIMAMANTGERNENPVSSFKDLCPVNIVESNL